MMKKYKREIKITLVILVISISLILLLGGNYLWNNFQSQNDRYVIISNNRALKQTNGEWTYMTQEEIGEVLAQHPITAYCNNEYVTTAYLSIRNGMFSYRENGVSHKIYPIFLGLAAKQEDITGEAVFYSINELNSNDLAMLNRFIEGEATSITIDTDKTVNQKVSFDIDCDGSEETLYLVSTLYTFNDDIETGAQLVIYEDNGVPQVVKKDVATAEDEYNLAYDYNMMAIFRFSDDETYDIILNRFRPMSGDTCQVILSLNENHLLEEVISCEEE